MYHTGTALDRGMERSTISWDIMSLLIMISRSCTYNVVGDNIIIYTLVSF